MSYAYRFFGLVGQAPTIRRRLLSVLTGLLTAFAGCAGPEVAPSPPVYGDHRYYAYEVAMARIRAVQARDPDRITALYADDAEIVDAGTGAVLAAGRAGIRERYAALFTRCPGMQVEVAKRTYEERGRFVTDVERIRCAGKETEEVQTKLEVAGSKVIREWSRRRSTSARPRGSRLTRLLDHSRASLLANGPFPAPRRVSHGVADDGEEGRRLRGGNRCTGGGHLPAALPGA